MEGKLLHKRSDGFYETEDGFVAVSMRAGVRVEDVMVFIYVPKPGMDKIRLEWDPEHPLQLFPLEISRYVLKKGWARQPTPEALNWFEETFKVEASPEKEEKKKTTAAAKKNEAQSNNKNASDKTAEG